ncbi:MAG: NADH-quinone oxidoreductase subunit NuoK [Planctomycetes bacterium]|nr:NADH-quinone oxidoreductase subunit NuoK [Planctomycetota bacterium]
MGLWQKLTDPTLWQVSLHHYLIVGALLFVSGLFTVLTRKNAVSILMGVELMLNSANLNFVAFSRYLTRVENGHVMPVMDGQIVAVFVIVLAACEAAIGLALILSIYHNLNTVDVDETDHLRG